MPKQRREYKLYNEEIERTFTQHQTEITQLDDSITAQALELRTVDGKVEEDRARMVIASDGILSTVSETVGADTVISTINQTAGSLTIDAGKLDITGKVSFSDLSTSGSTSINGANIQTGSITAEKIDVSDLAALEATIAKFEIRDTTNNGTTSQGGHLYTNSLYAHTDDGTSYEYELGLQKSNTYTNKAFYVGRVPRGSAWTSANQQDLFYIQNNGDLYAQVATIKKFRTTGTLVNQVSSYGLDDRVLIYKFDHLVFFQASYLTLEDLASFNFDLNELLGESCEPMAEIKFNCKVYVPNWTTLNQSAGSNTEMHGSAKIKSISTGQEWTFWGGGHYDQTTGTVYQDRFTTYVCQKAAVAYEGETVQWNCYGSTNMNTTCTLFNGSVVVDTDGIIHTFLGRTELGSTTAAQASTYASQCVNDAAIVDQAHSGYLSFPVSSSWTSPVWLHENSSLVGFTWQSAKDNYTRERVVNPTPSAPPDSIRYSNAAFVQITGFWATAN